MALICWQEVISFAHLYCKLGRVEYTADGFLSCFTVSGLSHSLLLVLGRCYGRQACACSADVSSRGTADMLLLLLSRSLVSALSSRDTSHTLSYTIWSVLLLCSGPLVRPLLKIQSRLADGIGLLEYCWVDGQHVHTGLLQEGQMAHWLEKSSVPVWLKNLHGLPTSWLLQGGQRLQARAGGQHSRPLLGDPGVLPAAAEA